MKIGGIDTANGILGDTSSSLIIGILVVMFLLFIAARGSLTKYKAILTQKNVTL